MKMSFENRIIISASAVVAVLVGWGILRRPHATSLFGMLNGDVRHFLQWPLFSIGKVPVTPLFLVKCTVFLIALSLFSRLFRNFLAKRVLSHTSMDRGRQYSFVRVAGYVIFLLGLVIGLDTTGLNLRSLLVVGGALSVGIGFGLQNIVANFVAGIVILWEGPIKLGDFIDVGNTHGEVIRIGARGTWVRTFDNEVIIVPNSEFINSRVANWTANDRTVRLTIPLGVSYDSDLEMVRDVLLEDVYKRQDLVNGKDAIGRDAEILKAGGSLVSTIYAADEKWFTERKITAHNISSTNNPLSTTDGLNQIARMLADGTITARIRSTVELDGAAQIIEKLRSGGLRGKAVIRL